MIRNFKTAVGATLASLVLGGIAASAAQATTASLHANSYPATLSGVQVGVHKFTFGGDIRVVTCTIATFSGTITSAADPTTLTPAYSGCTADPNSLPATVLMNGCDYSIAANTTGAAFTADILCPAGKDVEIHIYENATKHLAKEALCSYTIQAQSNLAFGAYDNSAGNVLETLKANPAASVSKGTKILCGAAAGSAIAMTYEGNEEISGRTDPGGLADGLEISP